jgi:hypothetical protein
VRGAAIGLAAILCAGTAVAGDDVEALLASAADAEEACDPGRAAELYREALDAAGSSRVGRRARTRLSFLESRNEGGWAPLAALLCFRRLPSGETTAERVRAFAAEARGFPPGRVRREALAAVAERWHQVLGDAAEAAAAYEAWLGEPGLTEGERQLAHAGLARARGELGAVDDSIRELHRAGYGDRVEAMALRSRRVAAVGRVAALAALGLFLVVGVVSMDRRRARPRLRAMHAVVALWVLGVPVILGALYEPRVGAQLAWVAGACALAIAASAWLGALASRRHLLAVLASVATLSAAFLAAAHSGLLLDLFVARAAPH